MYHRLKKPKSTSGQSNSKDPRPSTAITISTSTFPALTRFFGTVLLAAHIPFVRAGGIGEELSNNIIADLAPFIALFGEQVTKQFMSQSMGVADNIIFAVAPLGIITAIVGAIRVGGPKVLTAIIGRARESRSAVEIELMSSTSTDVCEMWDGKGVVRALGAAPIVELIYLIPRPSRLSSTDPDTRRIWSEGNFGIYDFDSAKNSVFDLESSSGHSTIGARGAAPNMSLNFGGNRVQDIEFFAVAVFGVMLQLGVIVYALLSSLLSPWNLQVKKAGYQSSIFAPLMISGTVSLVIGMYLCSQIIEQSTVEELWQVKRKTQKQAEVQLAWLQRGGEVNDQIFDSYAIFPALPVQVGSRQVDSFVNQFLHKVLNFPNVLYTFLQSSSSKPRDRNPRLRVRTSRQAKTADQHTIVAIAVLFSLLGFVGQFLGLRGLHWSVTVAQLIATCIMTVLRATIRRNHIHSPQTEKLPRGYELDWMARKIKGCDHWSVVTWGFDQPIDPLDSPDSTLAAATMIARRRLGALSKWPSQWSDTVNSTIEAIEESMNFMFSSPDITISSGYWSKRDRFEWKIGVQVGLNGWIRPHLEEITMTLRRTKLPDGPWGPWRAVKSEIEAVLGLWMLHFNELEAAKDGETQIAETSDWQTEEDGLLGGKPILRVLGPWDALERMSYECWIGRQTNYVMVNNIKYFTGGQTKLCEIVIAHSNDIPNIRSPFLGVITTTTLERICGQVLFSQFIVGATEHMSIGGDFSL